MTVYNTVNSAPSRNTQYTTFTGPCIHTAGLYHCVTGLISPEEVGGEGRIKPISGVLLFGPPGKLT